MLKQLHTSRFPIVQARDYDYALAKAALQGDTDAWDALYEDSWQFVLQTARQSDQLRLLAPDDYEDVTEEAFEKCYEHLERYQGLSRFCRWVAGYVKNLIRSRCARKQVLQYYDEALFKVRWHFIRLYRQKVSRRLFSFRPNASPV